MILRCRGRPSSTRRNTSTLGETGTLQLFGVGYQTWHNTVVLSRLARTLARRKHCCVTSNLPHQHLEIINRWSLPKNCSKTLTTRIVITLLLLATPSAGCTDKKMNQNNQNTSGAETSVADSLSIHQRAIAIDMHVDTVQRILDEHVDIQQQLSDGHFDAVRARRGSRVPCFFWLGVEPQFLGATGARAVKRADDQIEAIRTLADKH